MRFCPDLLGNLDDVSEKNDVCVRKAEQRKVFFGKSTVGQVIRSYPLMRRQDSFFGWLFWKLQQNEAVNYVDALTRQLEVTKHNPVPHCIRLSQQFL